MTINFTARKSKANRKGESPVELTICNFGERVYVSLPWKIQPAEFQKIVSSRRHHDLKDFMSLWEGKVRKSVLSLTEKGEPLSATNIKSMLLGEFDKVYTVSDMFRDIFAKLRLRIDVDMTFQRYLKYKLVSELFEECVGAKRDVLSLTRQDAEDFILVLRRKYKDETSSGKLSILKTMLRMGRDMGKMKVDIFSEVRPKFRKDSNIECLSQDEYERVKAKHFSIERLEKVKDYFIFACSCGLSYCDIIGLTSADIKESDDGMYYIEKKRQKTGVEYFSVILPDGIKILEKYHGDLSALKMSNQKANSYLKEIADLCEVSTNLHCHIARHFYITRLIRSGVPLTTVQRCAGHSNIKMTMRYTHLTNQDVLNNLKGVVG